MGTIGQALGLIISTLGSLLIGAIVLRFLLQAARADFYNPVSQALVKATGPIVTPFRKVIPGLYGLDLGTLVAAYVLNVLATLLLTFVYAGTVTPLNFLFGWSLVGLVSLILNIYFWALIISIVASWIAPTSANPVLILIYQLLAPIQSRVRRVIPPLGMIDISPIFIFLGIQIIRMFVVELANNLSVRPLLVIGI
jgi:YggT family protein